MPRPLFTLRHTTQVRWLIRYRRTAGPAGRGQDWCYPAPRPQRGTRGSFPPSEGLSAGEVVVGIARPAPAGARAGLGVVPARAGLGVVPARAGRFVRVVSGLGGLALAAPALGAENRYGDDGDDPDDDPDEEEGADDGDDRGVH